MYGRRSSARSLMSTSLSPLWAMYMHTLNFTLWSATLQQQPCHKAHALS
jgi:hypothetical protein